VNVNVMGGMRSGDSEAVTRKRGPGRVGRTSRSFFGVDAALVEEVAKRSAGKRRLQVAAAERWPVAERPGRLTANPSML
jgi:hypothetical protein